MVKFLAFNTVGLALLIAAYIHGYINLIWDSDPTRLTVAIFALFLFGLGICGQRLRWLTTREFVLPEAKIVARVVIVRRIAAHLVLLGLIGTVIGFIIALSGVDPLAAGNIDSIAPMVSNLVSGMSVALYTTLVGAITNLWLMANYHLLATAAAQKIG